MSYFLDMCWNRQYGFNLIRHTLPGFEPGSPTTNLESNKYDNDTLDRSAMDPLFYKPKLKFVFFWFGKSSFGLKLAKPGLTPSLQMNSEKKFQFWDKTEAEIKFDL